MILERTSYKVAHSKTLAKSPLKDKENEKDKENDKENPLTKALYLFRKANRIRIAIQKLRQRSKYRKPDKLTAIHYNLIDDNAFFKRTKLLDGQTASFLTLKTAFWKKSFELGQLKVFLNKFIRKIPVFKPNSSFKIAWDIFVLLLVLMQFFMISIELSFGISMEDAFSVGFIHKILAFFFFLMNILINFTTTFYEYGVLVRSRKKIIHNYVKTSFPFDVIALLALIPNILIIEYSIFNYFSIGFIFIWKTFKKTIENLQENYQTGDLFSLFSLFFKMLFLAHTIACFWHAIAFFSLKSSVTNQSWLLLNRYIDLPWSHRYVISVYWAFTTMCTVGYGDIPPQNAAEMGFSCMVMLIGSFGLGYCVNTVGILLGRMEESYKEFNENIKIVDNLMRRKNINQTLKIKVKKYLEFLWNSQNKNLEKEEEILEKLPVSLRNEILLESNVKLLKEFQLLAGNFSQEMLEFLALNFKLIQFSPTDVIYSQGSFEDPSIFLIFDGEIELSIKTDSNKPLHVKLLKKGDTFGEYSFFMNTKCQVTAQSRGFSSVYKISKPEFLKFLALHPKDHERFCEIRDKALFYEKNNEIFSCYSCNKKDHLLAECPLLRYIPDKAFIIERFTFTKPQKRENFVRNKIKKNTLQLKKNVMKKAFQIKFNKDLMSQYLTETIEKKTEESEEIEEIPFINRTKSAEFCTDKNSKFQENSRSLSLTFSDKKSISNLQSFYPDKAEMDKMFRSDDETGNEKSSGILRKPSKEVIKDISKIGSLNLSNTLHSFKQMRISNKTSTNEQISPQIKDDFLSDKKSSLRSLKSAEEIKSPLLTKSPGIKNRKNRWGNALKVMKFQKNTNATLTTLDSKEIQSKFEKIKTLKTLNNLEEIPKKNDEITKKIDEIPKKPKDKRTLFWLEFDKMKEFNDYFNGNNVSNVLKFLMVNRTANSLTKQRLHRKSSRFVF